MKQWALDDSVSFGTYREVLASPRRLVAMADGSPAQDLWGHAPELPPHDPERLARILDMLPARHADVFELTRQGVGQPAIAAIMGWTQPNVSTTLARAMKSIRLLLSLPGITEAEIERDLSPFLEPEQVRLLRVHFRTSHYLRTAEAMGMKLKSPSVSVRHRISAAIKRMRKLNVPELTSYITFFEGMLDNSGAWGDNRTHRLTKGAIAERDGKPDQLGR